jgi:hypothetical protein
MKSEYVPGVCNIGPAEIRSRRLFGWIGVAASIVMWGAFVWFRVPALWRLSLFIPVTTSAIGFLQAAMHFCAAYGILGVWNVGPGVGKTDTVEQAEFRRRDRWKAVQILLFAVLIGIAAAAAAYFTA